MTTKEKIDQMIEVLKSYKEGKEIEYRYSYEYCTKELFSYKENRWESCQTIPLDFVDYEYRIKPREKTSIPATEEDLKKMNILWIKDKKTGYITWIGDPRLSCDVSDLMKTYYKFNPDTKCWEDWSEDENAK